MSLDGLSSSVCEKYVSNEHRFGETIKKYLFTSYIVRDLAQ